MNIYFDSESDIHSNCYQELPLSLDIFWNPTSPGLYGGIQEEDSSASGSSERKPRRRMEANARERDRTLSVNSAFALLRSLIPTEPKERKLSKIEVLRLASSYISHLNSVCEARKRGGNESTPCEDRVGGAKVCTFCLTNKRRKAK